MPQFFKSFFLFLSTFLFLILVAQATDLPTNVTVLDQSDWIGTNFYSVADALDGQANIQIEREGGRGTKAVAKMRGSTAEQVTVLMNGRPLNREFDSQVDLSQIPINSVDRIEITRGGASVSVTGEAVGGVINIITDRPSMKGFMTRLGTGIGRRGINHSEGKFFLRNNWGDISYQGSFEKGDTFQENSHHKTLNHMFNITRSFNGKGYWGAEYFYQESKVGLSEGTPVPFDQWNNIVEQTPSDPSKERNSDWQHGKATLSYPEIFGGTIYSNFTMSQRNLNVKAAPESTVLFHQKNRNDVFDLKWKKDGLEIGGDQQSFSQTRQGFDNHKTDHTGLFAYEKWVSGKWTLVPGVRFDDDSQYGHVWSPRLAAIVSTGDKMSLNFSAQEAYRAPTFDELFISSAVTNNSNLKPETSLSFDSGVDFHPTDQVGVKVTGFFIKTEDLITNDATTNQWTNRGWGENKGVETEISLEGLKEQKYLHMKLTGNHTYQVSRVNAHDGAGFVPAAKTPHNIAFVRLDNILPRNFTISNELRYESEQFELANHGGVEIPSHAVWNLRIKNKILKADAYFEVENVANTHYAEGFGSDEPTPGTTQTVLWPQPVRTYWIGISIRFDN